MNGEKKVIEGIIPVTTTKAVYMDGTNKTLQEAIDNGELGGTIVTTASNFIVDAFLLINDITFTKNALTNAITINLNKTITLNRIMGVCWSNGSYNAIGITDGLEIPNNTALYWDATDNYTLVPYDSGVRASYNRVLVGLNWNGRITAGLLATIWERYYPYISC